MSWLATFAVIAAVHAATLPAVIETDIQAPGPHGPLAGTLLSPADGRAPVVLIIPGSGPVNRDGNGAGGLEAATYRLLAAGLAARGIATVRIDKRGMFGSRAAVPNADAVTIGDYAADVHAWVSAIRDRTGASCVWVLGHSEGGLVALVAGQTPAPICGFVLVAAPGRPLGAVLREQLRSNAANAPILDEALAAISQLEAGRHVDTTGMNPALMPLFRPAVQDFLLSEIALDPAALIAKIDKPVLVLQGDRDIQVSVADAERLKHADPAATLAILSGANHVLKTVASDRRADNVATYADPSLPLAPGVVAAVAAVVATHDRAR